MLARRFIILSVLSTLFAWASPTLAAPRCPAAAPLSSIAWREFLEFSKREYGRDNGMKTLGLGHALGRVAAAIGHDPERAKVVDCLIIAMNHFIVLGQLKVTVFAGRWVTALQAQQAAGKAYIRVMETAMGMHDQEVARATGVRNNSPAESYFTRLGMGKQKRTQQTSQRRATGFENGMNRPGSDFKNFSLNNPNPSACSSACQGDKRCLAWTYVNPGIQGKKAHCWLKNKVPASVRDACCVSGVVKGRSASTQTAKRRSSQKTAKKHPWDGLCLKDILKEGYKPIFAVSSTMWSSAYIFADPVSNQYVSVTGCTKQPWDMQAFQRDFREDSSKYYTYAENKKYFKSVGFKHRRKNEWVTLSYFR